MDGQHATTQSLRHLLAGQGADTELTATLAHVKACRACWEKASRLLPGAAVTLNVVAFGQQPPPLQSPSSYTDILSRSTRILRNQASELHEEREAARRDLRVLLNMPAELRHEALQQEQFLVSRSLVEALLAEAKGCWSSRVELAEELTRVALAAIEGLSDCELGSAVRNDLLAHCWAYNANCRRIQTDYRSAEQAFQAALFYLDRGTGDPLLRGETADLRASLRRAQQRYPEALEVIDEAVKAYAEIGDRHRVGRALMQRTEIYGETGEPESALRLLAKIQSLLNFEIEPRLRWVVENYRLSFLTLAGRNLEAWVALPAASRLLQLTGSATDQIRFVYLRGIIAANLGYDREAEAAFRQSREGFVEHSRGYDAAEVSIRLAALYLRQGRTAETKQLAAESLPIFQSRDIHREALAALMIFRQAAAVETATVTLAEEVSRYLSKARHNPALPYQPSS